MESKSDQALLLPIHSSTSGPTQGKPAGLASVVGGPTTPLRILVVVAFYWVVSLSVVFLNKSLLSIPDFPYPIFVTWYQLLVALFLLLALGSLGQMYPAYALLPPFEFNPAIAKRVLPLTIIYVLMLSFNNLCLQFVEVTFYQVARSLSIPFNILFTYTLLGAPTSKPTLLACGIVTLGFLLGSIGEMNFSWAGLFYGVNSSVFVALYGIYVKKTLAVVENNEWRLLHYNTAISCVLIIPVMLIFGEGGAFLETEIWTSSSSFFSVMTLTGVTGFLINIAVFLQIKVTTPLTNTISGTAKACVQTLLAWFVYQNVITALNGIGILLSLFGSGLYSYVRYREMQNR